MLAARHFGVTASADPLPSERDQNFRIRTAAGDGFVLKIANETERREILDLQNRALTWLALAYVPLLLIFGGGGTPAPLAELACQLLAFWQLQLNDARSRYSPLLGIQLCKFDAGRHTPITDQGKLVRVQCQRGLHRCRGDENSQAKRAKQ